MATTNLAAVIDNVEMAKYIVRATMRRSGLQRSSAVVQDDELQGWLEGQGGMTYKAPAWRSIDRDAVELTVDETAPVVFGGTAPTPLGITTHLEEAVRVIRAQVFSATKMAKYFNKGQADPLGAIGNDIAEYWDFREQAHWLATWAGIFADNDAAPSGDDTHTAGDLTHDVSNGGSFIDGQTNFTARNFLQAIQLMGDRKDSMGLIMCDSLTHTSMAEGDLIDFKTDSSASAPDTFMGRPIIINDEMPGVGNLRHTYIFGSGVCGRAEVSPDDAFEVSHYADGGNGLGQDAIWTRKQWVIHPYGHRFIGSPTSNTGGPINGDGATAESLAHAGSWSRTTPERKQIKVVRMITQELP